MRIGLRLSAILCVMTLCACSCSRPGGSLPIPSTPTLTSQKIVVLDGVRGWWIDVKAIIRMLKAEGKTIFLTSHHYKDIEQLCDQVYSLEDCQLLPITEEIAARYREMD